MLEDALFTYAFNIGSTYITEHEVCQHSTLIVTDKFRTSTKRLSGDTAVSVYVGIVVVVVGR